MKLKGAIAKKNVEALGDVHFMAGHHKVPRIWIIIGDKNGARIFSKAGHSVEMIGEAIPSEEEKTDKDDKNKAYIKGPAGSALAIEYEPSMGAARRKGFRFAHEIALWLDEALRKDAFDRLIFVAPPQTLRDLRKAISKPVYSRLLAEVNKNLAKLKEKDLREGLEKAFWF